MVGVNGDPGRGALDAQRGDHVAIDPVGCRHGYAGVDADDLDVIDGGQARHDLGKPARRQHQGIAAGQDHLPDFCVTADIGECIAIGGVRQRGRLARPDHLAAKAEPAIDRADMHQLEQHPVGISVHDAGHGRMRVVADRVGVLARRAHQFLNARNELTRDRIIRVFGIDQAGDGRRYRNRVARSDPFEVGKISHRREPAFDQLGGLPQRRCQFWIDPVHGSVYVSPAGGVHTT